MTLTWKDAITTLLAIGIAWFSYITFKTGSMPFLSQYRIAAAVLLVIGIGMCALGSNPSSQSSSFASVIGILAAITGILIIVALIFGTKNMFITASGGIVVLWFLTTLRHTLGM